MDSKLKHHGAFTIHSTYLRSTLPKASGRFSHLAAKDAIQSLDIGSSAFEACFRDDGHRKGSALVQARYDHSTKYQVPLNNMTRSEFVLRLHSTSVSARLVMEDYMLDNQYLLKKGNTVMMPGPVQHTFEDIWGPDVDIFDYQRFNRPGKCRHTTAFRAFGGGATLCSGRHFATTEILAFTAVIILRFDMRPKVGKWKQPSESKVEFWEAVAGPDEDLEVEIGPISGEGSGDEWVFTLSNSDQSIELSAEDLHIAGH